MQRERERESGGGVMGAVKFSIIHELHHPRGAVIFARMLRGLYIAEGVIP